MAREIPKGVERIRVGAYYTDGRRLVEITRVYKLGHVAMRDSSTEEYCGTGIKSFRQNYWLVRE